MLEPYLNKVRIEAGCDEAGRGCLAGPVFAAAVILPKKYLNPYLNDSKQLSAKQRLEFKYEIEKKSIAFAIGISFPEEIDKINILNASILAMHRAIETLSKKPEFLLIDGNRFKPFPKIPHKCIVKGDAKYMSIAAASILAKTYRDGFMTMISKDFPAYGWEKNKGYPTAEHREAIMKYGITPFHRRSFKLTETQFVIPFT
jgi:ribonuclease HII